MAIHPQYADAILDGTKHVEFRKRSLAEDITTVVIYATSPVKKIVGEFTVREIVVDAPDSIWERFGDVGQIDYESFGAYYANTSRAVALVIGTAVRYTTPQALTELESAPAVPQSFSYMTTPPPLDINGEVAGRAARVRRLRLTTQSRSARRVATAAST